MSVVKLLRVLARARGLRLTPQALGTDMSWGGGQKKSWGGVSTPPSPTTQTLLCPYHSGGHVTTGEFGAGGSQLAHVPQLTGVLRLPLDALLPQSLDLVVHVRHATVELVVLEQKALGGRRQVGVGLATVLARHLRQMHQDVLLQPETGTATQWCK